MIIGDSEDDPRDIFLDDKLPNGPDKKCIFYFGKDPRCLSEKRINWPGKATFPIREGKTDPSVTPVDSKEHPLACQKIIFMGKEMT
jgi:hypothetical protein